MMGLRLLLFFVCILTTKAQGQIYSRVEADLSIKEIFPDQSKSLMLGKVFFDLGSKRIVYRISFPQKEIMILQDSMVYSYKNDSLISMRSNPQLIEFSLYNLILNGDLNYFGLDQSKFSIGEMKELANGEVRSEWKPLNPEIKKNILISQKEGKIAGVAITDENGTVLTRQVFDEYQKVGRTVFPLQIFEIAESDSGTYKKMTAHKNVKFNDFSDEGDLYDPVDLLSLSGK